MRRLRLTCLLLVLGSGLPLMAQDRCSACHEATHPEVLERHRTSVHHQRGISCAACHGGDPAATTAAAAHASSAGFRGALDFRAATIGSCRTCHTPHVRAFRDGPHGKLATGQAAEALPDCADCHTSHGVQRASAALVDMANCGGCHAESEPMVLEVAELVRRARDATERFDAVAASFDPTLRESYEGLVRGFRHEFVQGVHRAALPEMTHAMTRLVRLANQAEAGIERPDPENDVAPGFPPTWIAIAVAVAGLAALGALLRVRGRRAA